MTDKKVKKDNEAKPKVNMTIPEGFQQVTAERVAGYFSPYEGATVRGILMGRFKRKAEGISGKPEYFYQVKLTFPFHGAHDAEKNEVSLEPGEILHIDERAAMEDLQPWVDKEGGPFEVYIVTGAKQSIKGGRTFWPMKIGARKAPADALKNAGYGEETPF